MAVTKVFRIELKGGSAAEKDIVSLKDQMRLLGIEAERVRAAISGVAGTPDTNKVADLKLKLADLEKQMISLNQQRNQLVNGAQKEAVVNQTLTQQATVKTGEFLKLNQQYKEAKINAQELAVKYGVESEQAIAAAQSAAVLRDQLAKVDRLVKTGGLVLTPTSNPAAEQALAQRKAEEEEMMKLAASEEYLAQKEVELAAARESANLSGNQRTEIVKDEVIATDQAGASVSKVTTKYEEFTGSLRQNLTAQLENETAINANRAEQKAIQKEITATGTATDAQTAKLLALREEELLLIETNKALDVTIRNQAKEFLAASNSLDEQQAQLNQLQQQYEALGSEKSTPFGQKLKSEIDVLEPKVKSLEAELGKFNRNVGNYPQAYTKAFDTLGTKLDEVKGKLVKGNFSGQDLALLAKQEQTLATATKVLGQEFSSTAKQQAALKEQSRQIGLVFGTDSKVFKDFAAQVKAGNSELKNTDKAIVAATAAGNGFTRGLSSIFGGLRKIAYAIPGIGLAGLIGLLLTPIGALASKLVDYATTARSAGTETERLNKIYEGTKEAVHGALDEFVQASVKVEKLRIDIDLAKKGFLDKNDVLKEYNDTLGKSLGKVTSLDEAERNLTANGEKYIQVTLLKAAANIALENAAKKAFEAEEARLKRVQDFNTIGSRITVGAGGASAPGFVPGTDPLAGFKQRQAAAKKAQQEAIKDAKEAQNVQKDIAKSLLEQAAKLSSELYFDDKEGKKGRTKLSNALQDALRLIEEARLRAVALENNRFNLLQQDHEATFDEEREHLTKIEKINLVAFDKKIALFERQKKLNAEEKRTLAEFLEQRSATQLKYNNDLAAIDKREFERKAKDLKNALDEQVAALKERNAAIQNDPSLSNIQRAQSQVDTDNAILAAEQEYYDKLLKLNSTYNKDVLSQTREALSSLRKVIEANRKLLYEGSIKDIADASGKLSDEFKQRLAQGTINVLTSDLSPRKQAAALLKLQQDANDLLLANQVAALKREVEAKKKALDAKLISEKDYQDKVAELQAAEAQVLERNIQRQKTSLDIFKDTLKDLGALLKEQVLGIKSYSDDFAGRNQKNNDSFIEGLNNVKNAINTSYQLYFKAQSDRIDKEKQATEDYLDRQKERVLATAQSEEERLTIERKYEQKRQKVEKEAAEKKRKLALQQATIDFAVAAIKTFATYGWPAGLIALAGLTAAYFAQRAVINNQQFAEGGKVQPQKMTNGLIRTPGNIKPLFNGDNVLATVRTGEVILNKRQQAALGGHSTFKALGVPGFASGGVPGASLKAPQFTASSFTNPERANADMIDLKKMVAEIATAVYATDKKQVELNPHAVTNAQNKRKKDVSLSVI